MSKRNQSKRDSNRSHRRDRRLRIRSIRRHPVDYQKLAGALVDLATAELAREADTLTDDVVEAEATAELERKQAVRQRRAERAARQREEASDDDADGDAV
jgi:hypothetical protein